MKWTAATVALLLANLALPPANAFAPLSGRVQPNRAIITTPRRNHVCNKMVSYDAIDAETIDYFYEDEDPDDPSDMKVSEVKSELDLMRIDYSDCFERKELEMRLREARENPGKFQTSHAGRPQDGPIGMKSVETSFVGLKQNVHSGTTRTKTQSFFGDVEGTIEVEATTSNRNNHDDDEGPPLWTQDATLFQDQTQHRNQQQSNRGGRRGASASAPAGAGGASSYGAAGGGGGGGQSLQGYLETDDEVTSAHRQHWHYQEDGPQKRQTFFADSVPTAPTTEPPPPSRHNRQQRHRAPPPAGNDRFEGTNHPSQDGTPRWSQFEGIKVEAPGADGGVQFGTSDTAADYNRRLRVEQVRESDRRRRSHRDNNDGTSMWNGVRVEPAGTSKTDDPFRSTRKQRPSYFNDQGAGTTTFNNNHLNLEPPPNTNAAASGKKYRRASKQEKKQYSGQRDFRYDQQAAAGTTFFKGIQVEQVPQEDDIHLTSYNREEQGGQEKDFRADPQRAEHHAYYKGIQVECAPGEIPPTPTPKQPREGNNKSSPRASSRTTSFQGVRGNDKNVQEQLYERQNRGGAHIPDDPFARPTLEHPQPKPRKTSLNDVHHNPGASSHGGFHGYEGLWEKTVGGGGNSDNDNNDNDDGGIPGNMDIDGRL